MKTHTIIAFKGDLNNQGVIDIHAYNIYLIEDWNKIKEFLKNYKHPFDIYVGCFKAFKNEKLIFDCGGNDFLECITENEISQKEYDNFTDLMPTYFGEHEIFEQLEELIEKKSK